MISYTITAYNESHELILLLDFLLNYIKNEDEIIVQVDSDKVTKEVEEVIENYIDKFNSLIYVKFPLDNDFALFKNNLKKYCSKEWIFNIDADEVPSNFLLENMHTILKSNENIDMFLVPRWNIVDGITDEYVKKWRWKFDEFERINWPDLQTRIYKNKDNIVWKNKVHERLDGFETYSILPEEKEFSLLHVKSIERQVYQNDFYDKIISE